MIIQWTKEHSLILKLVFFGSILVFVANQVAHIANGMSWQAIFETMHQQNKLKLLLMTFIGLLGVTPMLLYDWITVRTLEKGGSPKIPRQELFISAWITNTINNLAGFGGVVGASLRANFYGKQTDRKKVLATVSKVALFMLSGLSLWALLTFIDVFIIQPESSFRSYWIWLLGGSFVTPVLLLFVYLKRRTLFKELYPKGISGLVLASFGQWSGALVVFLIIGRFMNLDIPVLSIYPMFIIATLIGMLTMVPGGMGTFDVLMILGLSQLSVGRDTAVVWLLYYRLFYYVVPFLTGIVLFLTHTGVKVNKFLNNIPQQIFQKIAHFVLVGAVYFAGIMMVLLATVKNLSAISKLFQILLPFSFDFFDQTLNLLVGFLLLGLARALSRKVKKAYLPTIALLVFGILNTISRTLSWKLFVAYVAILLVVWFSRKEFYREKFVYSWGAIIFDGFLFGGLFIFYAIAGYHSGQFWSGQLTANKFILFPSDDVWFSGLVGLGISVLTLVTLYQYLSTTSIQLGTSYDKERIKKLMQQYGGLSLDNDFQASTYEYYYYQVNQEDKVVFAYQIKGNKCFIIGNPAGEQALLREATNAFMGQADLLGYQLSFYRVTKEYVILLHELGFRFSKVGEVGIAHLTEEDSVNGFDQSIVQEAKKKGYQFVWYDQLSQEHRDKLVHLLEQSLSAKNKENHYDQKRLSVAHSLNNGAGLVTKEDTVVGFITIQPMTKEQAGYDLICVSPDYPKLVSDYLVAELLIVLKEKGYQEANLGLAPLAGVGSADFSFFDEKVMNIIYSYGTSFYALQSIYENKARYADSWEGCYFAYMKGANFLFATLQLFLLIGGKSKNESPSLAEEVMTEI